MEQHIAFSGKLQMHVIDLNNLCPKAIHKLFLTTPHINKIIQNKTKLPKDITEFSVHNKYNT